MTTKTIAATVEIERDAMDYEAGVNGDGSMSFKVFLDGTDLALAISTDVMGSDPKLSLYRKSGDKGLTFKLRDCDVLVWRAIPKWFLAAFAAAAPIPEKTGP
jgi:hypothetical protein